MSDPYLGEQRRRQSILFMDDDPLIRTIAGEMIRELGYEVDFAEHGERAVELYRSAREAGKTYDVIILDLTVRGGMGGREALERIRSFDPGVKAIVSSGYSDDSVVADYAAYGFRACLVKPYQIETLQDVLNAISS